MPFYRWVHRGTEVFHHLSEVTLLGTCRGRRGVKRDRKGREVWVRACRCEHVVQMSRVLGSLLNAWTAPSHPKPPAALGVREFTRSPNTSCKAVKMLVTKAPEKQTIIMVNIT